MNKNKNNNNNNNSNNNNFCQISDIPKLPQINLQTRFFIVFCIPLRFNKSPGTMITLHARTMTSVGACTMNIVYADTTTIVHACTRVILHACALIIVHANTLMLVSACCLIGLMIRGIEDGVSWGRTPPGKQGVLGAALVCPESKDDFFG